MERCSCGRIITEETELLNHEGENATCFMCYRTLCKKCAVDIVSDYVCKQCNDEGSW